MRNQKKTVPPSTDPHQAKYSAYGTMNFSCSSGAVTIGQKAGQLPENSAGRHDVCSILKEGGTSTVHDIQAGEV